MKKSLIYSVLVASLFAVSCSEEFLNPVRNTQTLTDEDFANNVDVNPALVEGSLNGIYSFMITPGGSTSLTSPRHYDIGHKGIDIWSDMVCGDMALSANAYNWYGATSNLVCTVDYTREENKIIWNYFYKIINSSNAVINATGGNDAVPTTDEAKAILGQAKALRAYAYFYLTQLFQRSYDPSQLILPLYNGEPSSNFGKVAASEIYDLIVDDLSDAIVFLDGFQRTQKHQINKSVAQGLLAYTYAAMGNYAQVKVLSEDIINTGGYTLTTTGQLAFPGSGSGFNNVATPSWMWGYDLNTGLGFGLVSWWGQVDYFSYSYAAAGDKKAMDRALYDQIPTNDARKAQFSTAAATLLMPTNKFFDQDRVAFSQNPMDTDYIYMRIEEFYLLSAEASAKTGDDAGAKARLSQLLQNRLGGAANTSAYVNPLAGNDLKKAIYLQTRIELWGEGKSYLAMKRNQATATRGSNHAFLSGSSVPYDDDRLSFQIPQSELDNNPAITTQN
jgi:hypothetical protein